MSYMENVLGWNDNTGIASVRHNFFWSKVLPLLLAAPQNPALMSDDFSCETFNEKLIGNATLRFYGTERGSALTWVASDAEGRWFEYSLYPFSHSLHATIYSPFGAEDAEMKMLEVEQRLPPRKVLDDEMVSVAFWTQRPDGSATFQDREIAAPQWEDVTINYPRYARRDLTDMHGWEMPPTNGGRLLLLHGPAGTGKTNVIRSLARSWRDWCTMHYVVDPENFFGSAHYMMTVLLDAGMNGARWRLVIVEDADELLSIDAKTRAGQNVSRLLNLCDGLVGQGLRVLVLLTSNEPVGKMHPAIIRPGRCVANVNIAKLGEEDANEWRRAHDLATVQQNPPVRPGKDDATLAELYEELRQSHVKTAGEKVRMGFAGRADSS